MIPMAESAPSAFGNQVWCFLQAKGHIPAPKGCGFDGFDVLSPLSNSTDHVVVVFRREGALDQTGGNVVVRQNLWPILRDLTDAGFDARLHEYDDTALCVVVGHDADAADRALAGLRAYAENVSGGAR